MKHQVYDVIVVGVGGVGSSTIYHLASQGINVLGLEQFGMAHDQGSSHGETRAIRRAYFEHPDYVPLLSDAYENWRSLELDWGERLLHLTGLIEIGPADGILIPGVRRASQEHGLPLESLSRKEIQERMPGFELRDGQEAVFEVDAGYLLVEKCIQAMATLATRSGAIVKWNQQVRGWETNGSGISVRTDAEEYFAKKLVFTTGAWSVAMLEEFGVQCRILKKHLHWVEVPPNAYREADGSPLFFYETAAGCYYGFPQLRKSGTQQPACIKVAEHTGGELITEPANVVRGLDSDERARVSHFLSEFLPDASSNFMRHSVCMYTMSPDEHFVIDRHPKYPQICFAAGLSGHGFKFASALGKYLARMALEGEAEEHPAPFLSLSRFR